MCKAPESVLELINRQRHDQEGLLRTLASGLVYRNIPDALLDPFSRVIERNPGGEVEICGSYAIRDLHQCPV
jgi:hypothetical protein